MRIVTNPGSNLSPALVERYDIDITPQQIVVDGVEHDTRAGIDPKQIDRWIDDAREHPYVLGTSAAEFVKVFKELSLHDREVLAVMTSRKLIQSYDAAVSASRTLGNLAKDSVEVSVVDCGVTDAGAGLTTLLAAVAREAGLSLEDTRDVLERFCGELTMRLHIASMHTLIKGGRASFLRGWLANLLRIRPILAFQDGELEVAEKIPTRLDPVEAIATTAEEQYGGRGVWAAVLHGDEPEVGQRLAEALKRRLSPAMIYLRTFSPSIYLHVGRGAVGYFVAPIDRLGWDPPVPDCVANPA